MSSLHHKAISAVFWSFLQKIGSKGISFAVLILLARLLTPEDFGLIGMLMIFIGVSQALVNGGFSQALIQKKEADEEDYSSVFYINLVVSSALYITLYITAPLIAGFYHQPRLIPLTRVLSLVFIINAFSYVQEARLTKDIRFKTLMIIHIPSTIIGGVVSIVMAILGFGVWSIIAMQLVTRFAYAIQIWVYSKWKPLFSFNRYKAKRLFSFGSRLMVSGLIETVFENIYLVVIGKFFPLSIVGYYQNASNLVKTPSATIGSVLNSVAFPVFSTIQDDNKQLKIGYRKVIQQTFFWICPAFILAGVLATPLFRLIFSEKWMPAVPYFRWLCVVGILYPLSAYSLTILNVKGRSDLFLRLEIIKKMVVTIGIAISIPFGIWPLMIFQAASSVFAFFLNSYYSSRFIDYSLFQQIKDILPTLLLSVGMGSFVLLIDASLFSYFSDLIRLLLGFGIGGLLYWVAVRYWKVGPYIDILNVVQTKLLKRV